MAEGKLEPGTRVGEYVLQEKIGEGGFGSVWKAAHHAWPDRVVAVKIPTHRDLIEQLRREAEIQHALEKLDDRHIVKTLGLDTANDPPYFVMEYVEGASLRAVLRPGKGLPLERVLDYASQILHALDHAHRAGVVHLDLKPENILVTPEGVLKIMDFGLGYRPDPGQVSVLLSGALGGVEEFGGTLDYMAPEIRGGEPPTPRADVYAFGVILFEMLTGERPQPGDRPSDLNPAAPARLDALFERCYARAEKRYADASEVLEPIRSMTEPAAEPAGAPSDAAPAAPGAPPPPGTTLVPSGTFTFGEGTTGDAAPAHTRFLEAFHLDIVPVTCADFARFVRDGGYGNRALWDDAFSLVESLVDGSGAPGPRGWSGGAPPAGLERHPVTGVSYWEARAFARWAGKRLPSEAEWEKAARGPTAHAFPWGPDFDPALANTRESGLQTTTPVGRYRRGKSPCGALDMAGNVLEWTASFYEAYPGNEEASPYFGRFYRVLRGGGWYFKADAARVFVRHYLRPELRLDYVGFRCARDA